MRPTVDLIFAELPVYTALVALGVALGLVTAYGYLRLHSRRLSQSGIFLDGALLVLIAGWIGARLYHVATNWDYYALRTDQIVQLGSIADAPLPGGLGMRGGLMMGVLAGIVYAQVRRLSLPKLADAAAVGLALGQAVGWIGAWVQGANYGVVSDSRIAMELPDLYGLVAPRFPLPLAETLLYALVFVGLVLLAAQYRPAGFLFFVYLAAVSWANFALGFQRGDETAYWGALRVDQIIDAAVGTAGVTGLLGAWLSQFRRLSRANKVS